MYQQGQTQNYGYQQNGYPYGRNIYQNNQVAYPGIKGRPVTSFEEARASMIDFDGSVFYFPDLANKRIYTKQINMDGTALINVYEMKEMPVPTMMQEQAFNINPQNFVTRDEFNQAITQLREVLSKEPIKVSPTGESAAAAEKTPIALNF